MAIDEVQSFGEADTGVVDRLPGVGPPAIRLKASEATNSYSNRSFMVSRYMCGVQVRHQRQRVELGMAHLVGQLTTSGLGSSSSGCVAQCYRGVGCRPTLTPPSLAPAAVADTTGVVQHGPAKVS